MEANVNNRKAGKVVVKRHYFSEKNAGLLLVLPALLVILAIAIWPVIQSFYFSLFDLRLNDPTKRKAFTSYSLNIETYAGNYRSLNKTFDYEIRNAKDPAIKQELTDLKQKVADGNQLLTGNAEFNARYEQVDKLLSNYENVPSELEYYQIPRSTAHRLTENFGDIKSKLDDLNNKDLLKRPKDIVGSMNIIKDCIIQPNFIGLTNFKFFLTDARMWHSLYNTVIFTVVSVAAELVLGMLIAVLVNKNFRGRGLVRAAILVPWAIPTVVSAKMWLYLYNGEYGIVSKFFHMIGLLPQMGDMLTNPFWQKFAVIFADVWKTTPFMALLLLAGLQTIDRSIYESAMVDGASKVKQFFKITLPLLKSSILVALLFRTLDAFRVFDLIYVLLGRSQSSEVISTYAYQTMFAQTEFGAGSTLSVIVFVCIAIISVIFIRLLGSEILERG